MQLVKWHPFKRGWRDVLATWCVLLLIYLIVTPQAAASMQSPFFSTQEARHEDLSAFTKWTSVTARYEDQAQSPPTCAEPGCKFEQWEELITSLHGKSTARQIDAVNDFFNAIPYIEDSANYGSEDYWATPYEFMTRGGDCDDYAISKYLTLKRLGVAQSSMRIIVLQDNNLGGIMHAVLEVRTGGRRFLLDNQAKEVVDERSIFHYRPIYGLNNAAWWTYQ